MYPRNYIISLLNNFPSKMPRYAKLNIGMIICANKIKDLQLIYSNSIFFVQ